MADLYQCHNRRLATNRQLNAQLGQLAQALGVAIASGSQSVALRDPQLVPTFATLRDHDPNGFILANVGAGHHATAAEAAVAMLKANALEIHLNAAQEVVMPEGDRDFMWQANIKSIIATSQVPIVVKEVGNGLFAKIFSPYNSWGFQFVDVGGRGGTNFATIENARRSGHDFAYLQDWGQTTVESLLEARGLGLTMLATGGVRSPLDVVKALRLGAHAVGMSGLVLHHLIQTGYEATPDLFSEFSAPIAPTLRVIGRHQLAGAARSPNRAKC
jgi:isopentenyl-diphosphate Delta-isomerase